MIFYCPHLRRQHRSTFPVDFIRPEPARPLGELGDRLGRQPLRGAEIRGEINRERKLCDYAKESEVD